VLSDNRGGLVPSNLIDGIQGIPYKILNFITAEEMLILELSE